MSNDVTSLSVHQASEVSRAIARAAGGLSPTQWNLIVEHPDLAASIARLILNYGTKDFFTDPEQQFENVRRWLGDRVWAFGPSHFEAAQTIIPHLPVPSLDPLQATFLVPWLGVYHETLELAWSAVLGAQPAANSEYGRHLEEVEGVDDQLDPHLRPRLQWVQISLGANVGSPLFRTPGTGLDTGLATGGQLAGIHLLFAAAHSRGWARELGRRFPQVALGACRWRDRQQVHSVPLLTNSPDGLRLRKCTAIRSDMDPIAQPTIKVLGP